MVCCLPCLVEGGKFQIRLLSLINIKPADISNKSQIVYCIIYTLQCNYLARSTHSTFFILPKIRASDGCQQRGRNEYEYQYNRYILLGTHDLEANHDQQLFQLLSLIKANAYSFPNVLSHNYACKNVHQTTQRHSPFQMV